MKKILIIMALATMTIVVNAQNKVTSAKVAPEMVYYYTDFSIVRMKDSTRKKDVYVPYIGNDTDGEMTPFRDEKGNVVCFDIPVWGFNYITSLGWELCWHDDNHNAIQRWLIKKKVTKQQFDKLTKNKIETSNSLERIPTAEEQLHELVK
ncbi:MAG: hypothetical protein KIC42_01980 [Prevotella histicola]|jgi:hypothetical protein|uniref:hypothetical protein n=1 Tax=Prevotella histicola TaxID=470565 RepID=UPI00241EE704|nr:hypothetical protein [Prevotella histicola]MBS5897096.1 hypothetical protein [Prevotella histicola]